MKTAGGKITESGTFEPGLPHYLAYIPREYVEQIKDEKKRAELLERWDKAHEKWKKGTEHPPVGWFWRKKRSKAQNSLSTKNSAKSSKSFLASLSGRTFKASFASLTRFLAYSAA